MSTLTLSLARKIRDAFGPGTLCETKTVAEIVAAFNEYAQAYPEGTLDAWCQLQLQAEEAEAERSGMVRLDFYRWLFGISCRVSVVLSEAEGIGPSPRSAS